MKIMFFFIPRQTYYYELLEKSDFSVGLGEVFQLERSFIELPSFIDYVTGNQKINGI